MLSYSPLPVIWAMAFTTQMRTAARPASRRASWGRGVPRRGPPLELRQPVGKGVGAAGSQERFFAPGKNRCYGPRAREPHDKIPRSDGTAVHNSSSWPSHGETGEVQSLGG